jgi:3-phosphoshikimate 1-carboxyvinyltransferase
MPLDCGNSGTTMRLLAGILAGQKFASVLEGDPSLSGRPMERIARPLREMGAHVELTNGHAPIHITPAEHLRGIKYTLPMPSAQVKSCVLLAGLYANGATTVIETAPTRDHTERMLGLSALEMSGERHLTVKAGLRIPARHWIVPRDFSAAAFFIVAGAIASRGQLVLDKVGLNPTRSALLDVLRAMGCRLWVTNEGDHGGEPVGTVTVRPSELNGVVVQGDVIPILIDEVPILAVAAAAARGRTEIRDAMELRVKESDRIRAIVDNLRRLGAEVEEFDDGFAVEGGKTLQGTLVQAFDDHRIAMAMGVAALLAEGETVIQGASCAAVSFPGFWDELGSVVRGEK